MAKVRKFGNTWWGKAWLDALEQRALVDPNRLPRGRTYARQDRVREIELSPGELRAHVWGTREDPYTTTLSMRVLTEAAKAFKALKPPHPQSWRRRSPAALQCFI